MIVDIALNGKQVLLRGGEREMERKGHMYLDAGAYVTPSFAISSPPSRRPVGKGPSNVHPGVH